jgi:hypothetical protein
MWCDRRPFISKYILQVSRYNSLLNNGLVSSLQQMDAAKVIEDRRNHEFGRVRGPSHIQVTMALPKLWHRSSRRCNIFLKKWGHLVCIFGALFWSLLLCGYYVARHCRGACFALHIQLWTMHRQASLPVSFSLRSVLYKPSTWTKSRLWCMTRDWQVQVSSSMLLWNLSLNAWWSLNDVSYVEHPFVQMVEWWYQSAEERVTAPSVYPPPPPPPPPVVSFCAMTEMKGVWGGIKSLGQILELISAEMVVLLYLRW